MCPPLPPLVIRIPLLVLAAVVLRGGEPAVYFPDIDPTEVGATTRAPVTFSAPADGTLAEAAGIVRGDECFAVDGKRISSRMEVVYLLERCAAEDRTCTFTIRRGGEWRTLSTPPVLVAGEEQRALPDVVEYPVPDREFFARAGFAVAEEDAHRIPYFPRRLLGLVAAFGAEPAWLRTVVANWFAVAGGRFGDLDPIADGDGVPRYILALDGFLARLAERLEDGETYLLAEDLGVDPAFAFFNYPFAGDPLPELGELADAEGAFAEDLALRRRSPLQARAGLSGAATAFLDGVREGEGGPAAVYLGLVRAGILAPWFEEASAIYDWSEHLPDVPPENLIESLSTATEGPESLRLFAQLAPRLLSAEGEGCAETLRALDRRCPYLGALGRAMLADAARHHGLEERWRTIGNSVDGTVAPLPRPYVALARAYDGPIREGLLEPPSIDWVGRLHAHPFRAASLLTAEGIDRANRDDPAAEELRSDLNNAVWALASDEALADPVASLDGVAAMRRLTASVMPRYQRDTVAAAYARAGDFERAVLWQTWALAELETTARGEQGKRLIEGYTERLERYRHGRPASEKSADHLLERTRKRVDGSLECRGFSKDGERVGLWEFFDAEGRLESTAYYQGGIFMGPRTRFDDAGRPRRVTWYHRGESSGPVFEYEGDAKVAERFPAVDDEGGQGLTHASRRWTPDGVPIEVVPYRDHRVHGVYRAWHDDGTPKVRGHCIAGEPVGTWSLWDAEGERRRVTAAELPDDIFP